MSSTLEVGVAILSKLVCMSSYQLCQCIWKYSRGEYRIERGGAGYGDDPENRLRRRDISRNRYVDIGSS